MLERIQLLEDEIDKLSNGSLDQTVIHSPSKRHTHHNRPSYIPVRIRPTSSAQNRLRFAKGSKPPEPSSAPPQKKPPEPSVPPPPSVIQGTIKASGWSNQEIDVFSNQFSPQKFLDSLRFTHLGDNLEYLTPSQKISSQPNSLLSSNLKSEIPRTTAMIQENSPSPSLSSGSTSTCEEWQTAENSRVQSRRKIMSPSSAFFPVPELNKPTTSKGASERAVKKESKKVNQRNDFASSNDSSSHQQEPSLMVNGGMDLDAILARANHIVDRHKSFEETENQRASTEWVDEVDSTPSFTSSGVWKMIQDPQSERFYYYNQYTHECTWERPTEDEIEAVSQAFDTSYHGDHSSEEMHEEALVSTQLIHQTQLPPIEEVEEENIEVSTDNLASLDNKSPKSSFASAALRHLQRSIHIETEETGVGKDEGSGEINVAAALALADAILLKRNIVTLELEKQTEESSMMPPSSGDDERGKKNKVRRNLVSNSISIGD